jgi:hypothetical protein
MIWQSYHYLENLKQGNEADIVCELRLEIQRFPLTLWITFSSYTPQAAPESTYPSSLAIALHAKIT